MTHQTLIDTQLAKSIALCEENTELMRLLTETREMLSRNEPDEPRPGDRIQVAFTISSHDGNYKDWRWGRVDKWVGCMRGVFCITLESGLFGAHCLPYELKEDPPSNDRVWLSTQIEWRYGE